MEFDQLQLELPLSRWQTIGISFMTLLILSKSSPNSLNRIFQDLPRSSDTKTSHPFPFPPPKQMISSRPQTTSPQKNHWICYNFVAKEDFYGIQEEIHAGGSGQVFKAVELATKVPG